MDTAGTRTSSKPSSLRATLFSWTSRCLIWFSIITILFRCPESAQLLSSGSPYICSPYFSLRSLIKPHVQPYYEIYAAPYVDAARPYADSFNQHLYTPASTFAKQNYDKYAAPRVEQATTLAEQQWQTSVKPRVDQVKAEAETRYNELLQPHVANAFQVIAPPAEHVKEFARRQYRDTLIPSYQHSLPYISSAYTHSRLFLLDVGLPYTVWASKGTASFIKTRVWPPIRIVYGQNVEPQLAKIRQRLSSYRDGKKLEAIVEEIDQLEGLSPESTLSSLSDDDPTQLSDDQPPEPMESEEPVTAPREDAEEPPTAPEPTITPEPVDSKLVNDLKKWQVKFAKASDQGAEDLALRVAEIVERQVESQVNGVGEALITQLDEESSRQLTGLKSTIIDAVTQLPESPSEQDQDSAYSSVLASIRSAGAAIKGKAQNLRKWKLEFAHETESLVRAASDSTLDVIDGIRDLGLQEIGRRWASMEDVSYQDWAEYHSMKKTFDDWRVRVAAVAEEHQGLAQAKALGEDVEDRGMTIAQSAAAELGHLKSVARWKIEAVDASDDFEPRTLSAAAAKIGDRIKDGLAAAQDRVQAEMSSVTAPAAESTISEAAAAVEEKVSEAAASLGEKATDANPFRKTEPVASESGDLSQRVAASVESMVASAGRSAGPKAQAVLSAMVSNAEMSKGAAVTSAGAVSTALSELADEAASNVESPIEAASSIIELERESASDKIATGSKSATSVADEFKSKAGDAYIQASSTVAGSAASASDDIVEGASSLSEMLRSSASKVLDTDVPTLTQTVERVASSVVDDLPIDD